MARKTKADLERELLASEQAREAQDAQMKMMMEFMKQLAEKNGLEIPKFIQTPEVNDEEVLTSDANNISTTTNEVTSEELTSKSNQVETAQNNTVVKKVRKPRQPRVSKKIQDATEAAIGSPVDTDQPAIQLLSEEMKVAKEIQGQSNFVADNSGVNLGINIGNKLNDPIEIGRANTLAQEIPSYSAKSNIDEQNFFYKAGRFVGKAMSVVSNFQYAELLKNHVEKNKYAYTEAEKLGFPEEVEYNENEDPKIKAIEEAVKKTSEKSKVKVNFFSRGFKRVMQFVTFNNSEAGATAKVAKKVTDLFEANGIEFEKNARRDAYLKVIGVKDLAEFMTTSVKKDIIASGNQTEQDLLNSNYQKTSEGFIHNTLFELQDKKAGHDVIANYIQENVFVELRDKLCGAMRLYSDMRLMKNNDKDLKLISEFIDANNMVCSPSDVIEHLKKNPHAFESGAFKDKVVNPKFSKNFKEIIEKCDDYENKCCNLYAAMSTYVQSIETHKKIVNVLTIDEKKKISINNTFDDERNAFRLSTMKGAEDKFISFKKISEVVTEFMLAELEYMKSVDEYNANKNLKEAQENATNELSEIEKSLDNPTVEEIKPTVKRVRKPRVKKVVTETEAEGVTVTTNEGTEPPKKKREKRVVKSKVADTTGNVETTSVSSQENDANSKVTVNRAFLASRVKKDEAPSKSPSLGL